MEYKEAIEQKVLNNMPIRNPERLSDGMIFCEINHPEFGWIPFNASKDDVEEHGRKIFERIGQEFKDIPQKMEEPQVPEGPSFEERIAELEKRIESWQRK